MSWKSIGFLVASRASRLKKFVDPYLWDTNERATGSILFLDDCNLRFRGCDFFRLLGFFIPSPFRAIEGLTGAS